MAITSEIIGKLGGADVEEYPIGSDSANGDGVRHPLLTLTVSGRTLVTVIAKLTASLSTPRNQPQFYIGDNMGPRMPEGEVGWAAIVDTDAEFGLQTNFNSTTGGTIAFSGTVYVTPLE